MQATLKTFTMKPPSLVIIFILSLLMDETRADVEFTHISTVYLPSAETKSIKYDANAVEQIAYDPVRKLIYGAGSQVFHVINAANPANLTVELSQYEDNADFTDVEFCGDHVFLTVKNMTDLSSSFLRVHKSYDMERSDSLELVVQTEVGPGADMLQVLKNCQTVIVAAEGEAFISGGTTLENPKGQITIVQLQETSGQTTATVTPLGFDAFNNRYHELKPAGVRFVYTENNSTFSHDLEPEYITIDEETNKAYVVLQENNAIAEVDLTTQTINNIRGLGYKQWGSLDASDTDGGIRITYWPIRAWYTPDAAKIHQWQGKKLIFTANEGDTKEYNTALAFDETIRGKDISSSALGSGIPQMVKSALGQNTLLGRLTISKIDGKDETGNYSALYTYGGRSFSIWDLTSAGDNVSQALPQIFDSGSHFEEKTALHCPHLYNTNNGDTVDTRSDNKGPEPESLTVAEINNRLYIFIGNERPGTIFVYSLGSDVTQPRFETIFCGGIPDNSKTTERNFDDRLVYGVDPEDLRYLPAAESPTGRPMLMVSGTVSGTVTLLEVKVTDDGSDGGGPSQGPSGATCPNIGVRQTTNFLLLSVPVICLLLQIQ